jgi:MOSC N-terminal beta barrel domain
MLPSVMVTGTVSELWRYPIKSLVGERLQQVRVDERGIVGDRLFAVTDRNGKIIVAQFDLDGATGRHTNSSGEPGRCRSLRFTVVDGQTPGEVFVRTRAGISTVTVHGSIGFG